MPELCPIWSATYINCPYLMLYRLRNFSGRITPYQKKRIIFYGGIVVVVLITTLFIKNVFLSSGNGNKVSGVSINKNDQRISLPEAKATTNIHRDFAFPLKDNSGEQVSTFDYTITDALLQDHIVSKGKNYTTIKGRTILVLDLKITNHHDKAIQINTKDYVRLSVNNNNEELLAPDIHNDPVTVQATSTKYTRIGFPIYDTDTNLKLLVGEIGGDRQEVEIKFE
jgi:hypothetical protein